MADDFQSWRSRLRGHHSYSRVARASAVWAYMRQGLKLIVLIPTSMVLARLLTPEEFGIAAAAAFFGQLSGRLASGGMGSALVRIKELRREHISTVFTIHIAVTALFVVGLLLGAPFIVAFYARPEVGRLMPLVAVNFALGAMSMVQQALMSRGLQYREMATIGSMDITTSAIGYVTFASLGFSYWSLVMGEICGAVVKYVYGIRAVGFHGRLGFDRAAAREISSFAAGSWTRRLLEHLTRNVDSLIVGATLGMTALGLYDKAFGLVNRLYLQMTLVGPGVTFRIFSIIQDEPERFRRAYHTVIMTVTLSSYTGLGALGVMAPHLIVLAFGERWQPSVVPFQLLCVSFALKVLNQYGDMAAQAHGWIWPQVWRQIVQVLCLAIGVYLATPWGITGAAVAVLGASVVMFVQMQTMTHAATGLGWADLLRPQMPAVTLASIVVAVLWSIDGVLASRAAASTVILLAQAAAAVAVVVAFAWWCPFHEPRVVMYDVVNDISPRFAGWVWRDVAAVQSAEKDRRQAERGGRRRRDITPVQPEVDAGTHLIS